MNTRKFLKAVILAFITALLLNVLFCKPKSKPPTMPKKPETMESARPSWGD